MTPDSHPWPDCDHLPFQPLLSFWLPEQAGIDRGGANAAATAVHSRRTALRLRPGSMFLVLLAKGDSVGAKAEPAGALP